MKIFEYLAQNVGVLISLCAIVASLVAIATSWVALSMQRTHNRKSLSPLIFVSPYDYEDRIVIKIKNEGMGPAIVKKVSVQNEYGENKPHIFAWLPDKLPGSMNYKEYWTRSENFVLRPGSLESMLEIPVNTSEIYQIEQREFLRDILGELSIIVEYTDIYDSKIPQYKRELKLYRRKDHEN